eukprot:CAMPEP_0113938754 /NCGR_PEP_ID=MMETSP1339-20121228/5175_1 /TAXON_ID=94617 /ORGANISM="Fibrocapsa japonica" /LENGTH=321 /DNA_ID=CAMNT_0000942017 /DNA_START=228 /DNA_END=1193 /DNA_ORIENTATION=+ /assembly_acc=CAM_ASM_000762
MRALDEGDSEHTTTESVCPSGSMYCWSRCMELEPYSVSEDSCSAQGLELKCVNPRNQVYESGHGDYYPACSNSTEPVTPYPTLPEFPQNSTACSAESWDEFSELDSYSHTFDLTNEHTAAKFQWSVLEDGVVSARLAFNGIFGWLGLGFLNLAPDAGHNGMNGANVLLALPGDGYTAQYGLDLGGMHNVQEYVVSTEDSAFRHWQEAVKDDPNAQVEYDGCFTAISFEADSINGNFFNVTGADNMLWAGNQVDYYVGYHLRNRDIFTVEWSTGEAYFGKEKAHYPDIGEDDYTTTTSAAVATSMAQVPIFMAMVGLVLMVI